MKWLNRGQVAAKLAHSPPQTRNLNWRKKHSPTRFISAPQRQTTILLSMFFCTYCSCTNLISIALAVDMTYMSFNFVGFSGTFWLTSLATSSLVGRVTPTPSPSSSCSSCQSLLPSSPQSHSESTKRLTSATSRGSRFLAVSLKMKAT